MKPSLLKWSAVCAATLLLFVIPAAAQDAEPRAAPANDNLAAYTIILPRDAMNRTVTINTVQDATEQTGEPDPSCIAGDIFDTVWFRIEAPYDIHLVVDTFASTINSSASNHNTVIAVYSSSTGGATFGALTEEYCSSGGSNAGTFTWVPLPAANYFLQVGSEVSLSSTSKYVVEFGSRYQLLTNTDFGTGVAVTTPWVVTGTGTIGDKVVCNAPVPRVVDACSFRFKTSATEASVLSYTFKNAAVLPHDTGPTRYSEFVLDVDYFTERAQTNTKASVQVTFQDGTKDKGSGTLGFAGAIYVDPDTGATPVKAKVKLVHTGTIGKPMYITEVRLFYAPGATGRGTADAVLPVPAAAR